MIGRTLHHYQIRELIGAGGMGVVYKAVDLHLDRTVAIKVLPPDQATDRERRERFAREGRAVAALSHPNIVTIYAVEEHDGTPFLAMEYLEGKTLDRLIPPAGLELGLFFQIAIPIADALTAAHERHVTHRDLKPANVMVSETGGVKVLDFGLARLDRPAGSTSDSNEAPTAALTHAGQFFGTVPYMSPEQVQGQRVDHLSDLFSLGALLYEMAIGRTPFAGGSTADLISGILRDTPTSVTDLRPELPRHLARIIRHCLEKDPARRYQTALDVANELRDLKNEVDSGEHAEARRNLPRIVAEARQKTHMSPLVGRQAELAELRRLLEQAHGGQGSLTLIGGEPGVGKTRMIEELIPAARELGFLTLVGHCYDTEGARPWSPWVEILEYSSRVARRDVLRQLLGDGAAEVAKLLPELRRLYPDIPVAAVLPPEQERHYLFASFREYLERSSQAQPLLLALEDLQWADESTLLLLQHLAPHLDGMAILAVGTYRDDELDVSRPLGGVLRHLVRERLVHRVALKSLPAEAVAEMLAALSEQQPPQALVAAIFKTTEGNPFFVEEVFGHLREEGSLLDREGRFRRDLRIEDLEVPEGVRLVVGRRLEKLGEEARKALTAAAVIGRRFHFDLLEALGDSPAEALVDAIEEAERLQLIKPVPGREIRFDFAQELVRQTLAGGLSSMRRQRLHLRIAEAMERVFAGDLDNHASELAHHFYQAGAAADPQKTVRYLIQAGRQALAAAAPTEALRRFEDALSMVDPEDRAARADLLFRRGLTLRSLARWEDAKRDWLEALPLYEELGDAGAVVRLTMGAANQILWTGHYREAAAILQRGLHFVGEVPTPGRCRLLAAAATAFAQAGDLTTARPMMEEAFTTAEQLAVGPRVLGEMFTPKAFMHLAFLEFESAIGAGRRGGELLLKRDEFAAASALSVALSALLRGGRLRESAALAAELEPLARRLGHSGALFFLTEDQAARTFMERGDFAAVLRLAETHEEHLRAVGQRKGASLLLLGLAQFWGGRLEESLRSLEAAYQAGDIPEFRGNYTHGEAWAVLFTLRAFAGHRQAALAMLELPDATMPRSGQPFLSGDCSRLHAAVEGLAALGEPARAAELYPLVLESLRADHVVRRYGQGLVRTVAGIGAACARQWEEAEKHFVAALELAYSLPHVVEQAEVRYWHAKMLLERNAAGDRERAGELLGAAIEIYQKLGMPLHLARARELAG